MQSAPATQAHQTAADYLASLPPWLQITVGFILVGLAASTLTTHLRAAFPASLGGWRRSLHYLYPGGLGATFATGAAFAFPGFGIDSRWLLGLVAPYVWTPLYEIYKKRYEKDLGITLPSVQEITGEAAKPAPSVAEGPKP
jgi:hypothetical protein